MSLEWKCSFEMFVLNSSFGVFVGIVRSGRFFEIVVWVYFVIRLCFSKWVCSFCVVRVGVWGSHVWLGCFVWDASSWAFLLGFADGLYPIC